MYKVHKSCNSLLHCQQYRLCLSIIFTVYLWEAAVLVELLLTTTTLQDPHGPLSFSLVQQNEPM